MWIRADECCSQFAPILETDRDFRSVFDDVGVRIVLVFAVFIAIWLGLGPSGIIPGIESLMDWTHQSLLPIVRLH